MRHTPDCALRGEPRSGTAEPAPRRRPPAGGATWSRPAVRPRPAMPAAPSHLAL